MVYPKTCEYEGWKKIGGKNCFRLRNAINSPRERCNGPKGCVWRSQRSRSPKKSLSQSRSRSPSSCIWGKRSIYEDRVGTCYNRDAVRFNNTGWRKCNYPSNCVGKNSYDKTIYYKNDSDDEDNRTESSPQRKMTCDKQYIFNFHKLNKTETEVVNIILNSFENTNVSKNDKLIQEILNDSNNFYFGNVQQDNKNIFLYKVLKKLDVVNILDKKSNCTESDIKTEMAFLIQLNHENLKILDPDTIDRLNRGSL